MGEPDWVKHSQEYLDHQIRALLLGTTLGVSSDKQETALTFDSFMATIDEFRAKFLKNPTVAAIWLISHTYEQQYRIDLMFEKVKRQLPTVMVSDPNPSPFSTLYGIWIRPWCLAARQAGEPLPPSLIWAKPGIYLEMSDGTFLQLEMTNGPTHSP